MALAPLGAFVAVTGTLIPPLPVVYLAAFSFFWISGFDITYGLQDMDFDSIHDVRSIPAGLGMLHREK